MIIDSYECLVHLFLNNLKYNIKEKPLFKDLYKIKQKKHTQILKYFI